MEDGGKQGECSNGREFPQFHGCAPVHKIKI